MLDWLVRITAPWNSLYSDNTFISTGVVFLHLAAVIVGAVAALGADRRLLRSRRYPALRVGYLEDAPFTHRTVVSALALAFVAGLTMFLADVEALATSRVFWIKLAMVGLLLGNGLMITRLEKRMQSEKRIGAAERSWKPLFATARTSQVLWLATVLAGVALRNA